MKDKSPLPTVNESSIIEFNRFHFVLKNLLPSGVMHEEQLYYSSYPPIRQAVRKLTNIVVTDFNALFEGVDTTSSKIPQEASGPERGFLLGKLIDRLEYITMQGNVLTAVTSEQRFVTERIGSPLLKSLIALIRKLIASASPAISAESDADSVTSPFPGTLDIASLPASLTCLRCGRCCNTYDVIISPDEIERISAFLGISKWKLEEKNLDPELYTWSEHNARIHKAPVPGAKGRDKARECVFLREERVGIKSCAIYEARPKACRSYLPGTTLCPRPAL
jgi:Fe-S-cluster containining protein